MQKVVMGFGTLGSGFVPVPFVNIPEIVDVLIEILNASYKSYYPILSHLIFSNVQIISIAWLQCWRFYTC